MEFTKMHGCGNDYIYIDGTQYLTQEDKASFVKRVSHRHLGIGGDGVIFIHSSKEADFEMEMYNADGSRGEMCGNGIRCVAKYVYDKGLTTKRELTIVSAGSIKYLELFIQNDVVKQVRVNMGEPILKGSLIPVNSLKDQIIKEPITIEGEDYEITCVSMGNPHAIVFQENVEQLELMEIGPKFEHHPFFPKRVNTEFVEVINDETVYMRVWERGSGETLACGTGCCATVVACVLNGLTKRKVTVKLLGGQLEIEWDEETNNIYMTGSAEIVFEGHIE